HAIDTGDNAFQEKDALSEQDDDGSLYERLRQKGAMLVMKTGDAIAREKIHPYQQELSEAEIRSSPKIFKDDCKINWSENSEKVINFIRGLSPYPAAWTNFKGKILKIFKASPALKVANFLTPGEFKSDNQTFLHFRTNDGMIAVEELQLE